VQFPFWSSVVPLYPARHPKTFEVIHMVLRLAKYVEMSFKNALCVRRAHELSAQVQPIIEEPVHGSLPSGHSTEAHAVARVLFELVTDTNTPNADVQLRQQLMRQAARIAINRTVAGVHFPVDSMVGQMLGLTLGEYFIKRCGASASVKEVTFDGTNYPDTQDFSGTEIADSGTLKPKVPATSTTPWFSTGSALTVTQATMLSWLWGEAKKEWP